MALVHTPDFNHECLDYNKDCPDFNLKAIGFDTQNYLDRSEKYFSLNQFKNQNKPLLVMFICNHCPYVKAIEDRLIQLGHDLKEQEISVVAIASNDDQKYPDDSFENLQNRFYEKKYSFLYLHDPTQEIAKAFGAVCTPDYFLYDQNLKLKYRGRLDDNWKQPELVKCRELYLAALEIKNHQPISRKQIPSMGCSIKWKSM